ncbi:MAG TPA: 16S rRNA (cytosine(967)-C(5))-methyltransferase RsmB [Coleofasciculaceae cyanobacterium]
MADLSRKSAFEILLRFERGGATRLKADSLIQDTLATASKILSETDRGFTRALVMGTLRHWLRLDEWIKLLTGRPLKNMTPPVRTLLRVGLFQLYGMAHVPAYAAIDTTVELAKALKVSPKTVKFINAVLREGQRALESNRFDPPPASESLSRHLLMAYGWPEAWVVLLQQQYDDESILQMARVSQSPAPLSVRVNTLKISPAAYQEQLAQANVTCSVPDSALPESLRIDGWSGSPRALPGYEEGWFYVQDPSSVWVSRFLNPEPGEQVLDLCAAPGSKTTHMSALMENQGKILAIEPKKDRLLLLKENMARLGVENTETVQADGLAFEPEAGLYDRVLVDAPCSGTGTLRRHPEILLQLKKPDFSTYTAQQSALLTQGFSCLKPGGVLVYSTCSLMRAENHSVVAAFLKKNPEATLDAEEQRLITESCDGFYAARLRKK